MFKVLLTQDWHWFTIVDYLSIVGNGLFVFLNNVLRT